MTYISAKHPRGRWAAHSFSLGPRLLLRLDHKNKGLEIAEAASRPVEVLIALRNFNPASPGWREPLDFVHTTWQGLSWKGFTPKRIAIRCPVIRDTRVCILRPWGEKSSIVAGTVGANGISLRYESAHRGIVNVVA